MKETKELNSAHAAPKTNPKQLLELSRLEIKRRELWQDLAYVQGEMYPLNREVWEVALAGNEFLT